MSSRARITQRSACALALSFLAFSGLSAQSRLSLPSGSVILVRTETPLESATARVGQEFQTSVIDTMGVDGYTVIPSGSRIRGMITFVQPATRQKSGVIEVNFDRLTLPDGTTSTIDGRLTSLDAAERRQIESDPNARVVLVGGRGGIGAAIAGAGSDKSPASGILGALGSLLSEARDVRIAAGTQMAVQLQQGLVLRGRGSQRFGDRSIYTNAERISAAQQALARENYYRGSVTGRLDEATQRALFEFQIDKGIVATGNLDGRTAQALGLSTRAAAAAGGADAGAVLSAEDAALVRRGAQALAGRQRADLGISTAGRLDTRRTYGAGDLDLWFALSAFADNASLYEQVVRVSGNAEGALQAGRALVSAARRVDSALSQARASAPVQNGWTPIRQQLSQLDRSYR
jgi:peptidoglycan hydrolase-like protein with peptidoglycan-binding domain